MRRCLSAFSDVEGLEFIFEMNFLQVLVEHNYRHLMLVWSYQDFIYQLKVCLASIALLYATSAIFFTLNTDLYSSGQAIENFQLIPPSLGAFVAML